MLLGFYNNNNSPFRFNVVGEAASLDQAVNLTASQHPALVLLDLELSQGDGVSFLLQLEALNYRGKVLVLSAHQEDEWVFRTMQAGARGFISKDQVATHLCEAIATVLQDQVYLSPEVATRFFRLFHFYAGRSLQVCRNVHLTDREQEVLHWLVQGASNEAISQHLHITIATVKAHLTAIFEKLEVTSRTQAIVKALKLGLVTA